MDLQHVVNCLRAELDGIEEAIASLEGPVVGTGRQGSFSLWSSRKGMSIAVRARYDAGDSVHSEDGAGNH